MSFKFDCSVYAKWILCGEHSVIRGYPAIVCPIKDKKIDFSYVNSNLPLEIETTGIAAQELKINLPKAIHYALDLINQTETPLQGKLNYNNSIPVGGGLGLSAAISCSIAKWFHYLDFISADQIIRFARSVEDLFHGKSSGVDVAGSLHDTAILYKTDAAPIRIEPSWSPCFTLSYCGVRSNTHDCVQHVSKLSQENLDDALQVDKNMSLATELAHQGLTHVNHKEGLHLLKESLQIAENCFKSWDLFTEELKQLTKHFSQLGAVASKPTGSGAGGYLLSLWDEPPQNLPSGSFVVRLK